MLCAGAVLFGLSAAATIYFGRSMSAGMEMPGEWTMSRMWMRMPGQTWAAAAAIFLLMWLAMMVAMMLPSAMPMWHRYGRWVARAGNPGLCILLVAGGYFAVWMVIGLAIYVVGVSGAYATMRWTGLSRFTPTLLGAALAVSGTMQFSWWKMAALRRCRDPLAGAPSPTVGGWKSAWSHGVTQGVTCAICCSGPMLALLALGAMNLAVMAILAAVIAVEKLAPRPDLAVRLSGAAAFVLGIAMMLRPILLR